MSSTLPNPEAPRSSAETTPEQTRAQGELSRYRNRREGRPQESWLWWGTKKVGTLAKWLALATGIAALGAAGYRYAPQAQNLLPWGENAAPDARFNLAQEGNQPGRWQEFLRSVDTMGEGTGRFIGSSFGAARSAITGAWDGATNALNRPTGPTGTP